MNKKDIARRIREIREQRDMSQQDLAELMGWKSHSSIAAIENGEQDIKVGELLKLANLLKVPLDFFYSETAKHQKHPIIFWREKPRDQKIAQKEELTLIQDYENYRLVERLAEAPSTSNKTLPQENCDINSVNFDWANQLAQTIHKKLHLGDYPAALLKKCLEEEYGVLFIGRPLENGSAACVREESGAVIMLNERAARWRQTFDLAHELFHLITWNPLLIEQVQSQERLFQKNEQLANAFAAALLMPQQMIDLDMRGNKLTYSFIVALAGKYQVSKQAMLIRLRYLKYISSEAVDQTIADPDFLQLDHSAFKQAFPSVSPLGNRFVRLAYLAYEKGRISKARLAQILNTKLRDLDQYLEEKGLCLTNDKEIERFTG